MHGILAMTHLSPVSPTREYLQGRTQLLSMMNIPMHRSSTSIPMVPIPRSWKIYSKNIGLVYRKFELWEYQTSPNTHYTGFGITMWMIDHNHSGQILIKFGAKRSSTKRLLLLIRGKLSDCKWISTPNSPVISCSIKKQRGNVVFTIADPSPYLSSRAITRENSGITLRLIAAIFPFPPPTLHK